MIGNVASGNCSDITHGFMCAFVRRSTGSVPLSRASSEARNLRPVTLNSFRNELLVVTTHFEMSCKLCFAKKKKYFTISN